MQCFIQIITCADNFPPCGLEKGKIFLIEAIPWQDLKAATEKTWQGLSSKQVPLKAPSGLWLQEPDHHEIINQKNFKMQKAQELSREEVLEVCKHILYLMSCQVRFWLLSKQNKHQWLPKLQSCLHPAPSHCLGMSHTPPALRGCQAALSPGFCGPWPSLTWPHLVLPCPPCCRAVWLLGSAGWALPGALPLPGLNDFSLQSCISFTHFDIRL